MMSSEELIPLVFARPEIWDQSHALYTSKKLKVKAWANIAEKLNVTVEVAKARWTNLRDLFRRELKKTLKMAEETGDPNAHKPRWKHFKTMLFLKDQIIKSENANALSYEDSYSLYPQAILGEGDDTKFEEDAFVELDSSPGSSPTRHNGVMASEHHSFKRNHSNNEEQYPMHTFNNNSSKRYRWDAESGSVSNHMDSLQSVTDVDEDYHFVMSILPSIRRVRQERKTSFKLKVLQLIVEEENTLDAA